MAFPGPISFIEPATGLLVRGISINGKYLFCDKCTLNIESDIDEKWYIQGGARAAIASIGKRIIKGEIIFPLRIKRDGTIEDGILEILKHTENPDKALKIDTNHTLITSKLIADCGGTDYNEPLSLPTIVVEKLSIHASKSDGVLISANLVGTLDARNESEFIAPPDGYALGRQLSFADCQINREHSSMDTVTELEITVENKVKDLFFIVPYEHPEQRTDMPNYFVVHGTKWGGSFTQFLRRGIETNTYIHGGFMQGENLILSFGILDATIPVPLFKPSTQDFTADLLIRKTDFYSQNWPRYRNPAGDLFNLDENKDNCNKGD